MRRWGAGEVPLLPVGVLLLAHVGFTGNRFVFTLHAIALHASSFQIGLLLAALMVGPMLFSVGMGRLTDRHGYARVGVVGIAMVFAGSATAAAFPGLAVLYAASVLTGTGFMATHVALNTFIGRLTAARFRTDAFSAVALAFSISGFCTPLLAGASIELAGYRVACLVLLGAAVGAGLLLRSAARHHPSGTVRAPAARAGAVVELFADPRLRAVFLTGGLFTMAWDLFTFFAPLQGVRAGLSPVATGAIVSALSAGMFAVRLGVARLTQRIGEWATMAGALLLVALVFLVFPLLHALPTLVCAAFVLGMGLGCGQPVSMALLYQVAPEGRAGEAVGARATITSVSQTLLPMLLGALGTAVGLLAVFWSGAVLFTAGAWTARRGIRKKRRS